MVVGAIVAPAQRTATAVLRIMGLSHEPQFQTYHRVLNRAVWSSWEVSRVLLLVKTFAVRGPIIVDIGVTAGYIISPIDNSRYHSMRFPFYHMCS